MPTPTYTPLATVTLGSTSNSVTFSSIPATYRDLILVSVINTAASSSRIEVQANSVTSGYPVVIAFNTSSQTFTGTGLYHGYTEAAERCTSIMQIMDYSATDKHKTAINRHGTLSPTSLVMMAASRFASTNAITSLKVMNISTVDFSAGSTFNLYGVIA
jgi:hypothetical protein